MSENMQFVRNDCDTVELLTTSKTFNYTWTIKNIGLFYETNSWTADVINCDPCSNPVDLWYIYLILRYSEKPTDQETLRAQITFYTKTAKVTYYDQHKFNVYIIGKNVKDKLYVCKSINKENRHQFFCDIGTKDFVLDEKNGLLQDGNLMLKFEIIFTKKKLIYNNINSLTCTNKPKFIELENMLNNDRFSDAKISVDGKEFHVHKVILASRSPVFAAMFEHNMKENIENIVEIADIDKKIMEQLLYFIYTAKVNNIDDIAHDLLGAADKYEIDELRSMCETSLIKQLKLENLIHLLSLAEKYRAYALKEGALQYFKVHVKEIIRTEIFKKELNTFLHLIPDMFKLLADSIK